MIELNSLYISIKKNYLAYIVILLLAISVIPYFVVIKYTPIGLDAGYYLSIVERIRDGYTLYSDIKISYTPFFFYIVALVKDIFDVGADYSFDLFIYVGCIFISAIFLCKLAYLLLNNWLLSILSVVFFIQISFWIAPLEFLLEFPSIMWGTAALSLLLSKKDTIVNLITVGFLLSLSFMTKQYGLGYLFLALYIVLFMKYDNRVRNSLCVFLSFCVPIILYVIYNPDISDYIFGSGYSTNNKSGFFDSFYENISSVYKYLIYRLPVIIISILIVLYRINDDAKKIIFLLFGIIGFSLQFIFEPLHHYLFYIIPFISILLIYPLKICKLSKVTKYVYILLILFTFVFSVKRTYARVWNLNSDRINEQYLIAGSINKIISKDNSVYIADYRLVYLYYLLESKPINLDYSFGVALNPYQHFKRIIDSDYVISWENFRTNYFSNLNSEEVIDFYNRHHQNRILILEKDKHLNEITGKFESDKILLYKK